MFLEVCEVCGMNVDVDVVAVVVVDDDDQVNRDLVD